MEISINAGDGITIIGFAGKLDGISSQGAYDEIIPRVTCGCRLIFDMNECVYISSAGLRILLMLGKLIKKNGGQGVMSNLSEEVQDVMEMTGFDHIFKNYPTNDEAIAAIKD